MPESKDRKNVYKDGEDHKTENEYNDSVIAAITFKVSGNRKRDIDGMTATLFDCLVAAEKIIDDNLDYISGAVLLAKKVPRGHEGMNVKFFKRSEVEIIIREKIGIESCLVPPV